MTRLLIGRIVYDAETALNEGKDARDVEIEAKADQDVVLNLYELLVTDEIALLE
jgi:hypothetical protein